ncbi:carbohydrate ABC transporter substrate-binding protein (CUT1 family) [Melghirimyces profundicolus]|uniref:Carbohydrate ABC transporter substrate-binding protein (CUT1 family) n=1 Tax=Melghirimyces profundicolus TaxID=1242148 RepID=A0A2T6BW37_9BACL|nr:ABC transporter substrate-binding protein [Melghirimyces profundicolus]PTX60300.1 carbohydrate ABC transporter substrate-binding protein (CUT1 family) [Melghirimyces profundicolus]
MKKLGWILVSVLLLVAQTSCSSAGDSGKVELTYWPAAHPVEVKFAKDVVKEWNRKHPDIQVKVEPLPASRSTEEVLLTSIAGGTTPDLTSNINPGALSQFVEAGGMYAIDKIDGAMKTISERTPKDTVESFKSKDGHLYQIPWKGNPVMVIYNKKHFKEAGLDPENPDIGTYSKFLKAADKLTRDKNGDGKTDVWAMNPNVEQTWWQRFFDFYPWYLAAKEGETLLKGNQAAFDNPEAVETIRFFKKVFDEGYAPKSTFKENLLAKGKVSMTITGPFALADLEKQAPDTEFGVVPVPVPDDMEGNQVITYGDPKNIGIFKSTEHPKETWEFAKFLISKKNDLKFLKETQQIPFRKDLEKDEEARSFFEENPLLRRFAEQAPYTRATDDSPKLTEAMEALSLEYQKSAVLGKKSPEKAIKDAEKKVNEILKRQ